MSYYKRFMLLGSGELGREFVIAAKRLGCYVVAIGRYANAPAMQLADAFEVIDMFNGEQLEKVVLKYNPDYIVPEIEAINIEKLVDIEKRGINVVPCANAIRVTMDRKALRLLASEIGLETAKYQFAKSQRQLEEACTAIGFPCVVKPLMSSSGKGQTVVYSHDEVNVAWNNLSKSRGTSNEAIVEQFIDIRIEITLLTISTREEEVLYCKPIGHVQSHGDYQESWQPANVSTSEMVLMSEMADKIVRKLGGFGLWGSEFFISNTGKVYFSEISPRPHDTGMVTLANTQFLNQFELHLYAILGLDITNNWGIVPLQTTGASVAICDDNNDSDTHSDTHKYRIEGISEMCDIYPMTKMRLFSKPISYKTRRLGVILSSSSTESVDELRITAKNALQKIKIVPL